VLSQLRQEKDLSQRKVASDLGISQALLSHYENGLREPKLEFVVKVCDYYGVSADYMLGRTSRDSTAELQRLVAGIRELGEIAEKLLDESGSPPDHKL
jgi:transcriptional regulator with XRE-family HTH domain